MPDPCAAYVSRNTAYFLVLFFFSTGASGSQLLKRLRWSVHAVIEWLLAKYRQALCWSL